MSMPEPRVAIAGNTSFPGECERCSCDVRIGDSLCNDCSRSVPMFEQSSSFHTVSWHMLIQAEPFTLTRKTMLVWNRDRLHLSNDELREIVARNVPSEHVDSVTYGV